MEPPTNPSQFWPRIKKEIQVSFRDMQPVWPFFLLLTGAMIVLYILTLINTPWLRQPWNLVLFSLLMLIHTALHWSSPAVAKNTTLSLVYMVVQVGFVIGMIVFTHSQTLVLGLFMGLAGEALGVIRPLRRSLVAIFFLLLAAFLCQGLVFGWAGIGIFMISVLPLTFFVVIYVYLFTRQMEERKRAETLLQELEVAHRQLSEYATRIEELTLTNERQRMARELHDTLSQGLAGLILQLEAADQHLSVGHPDKASGILKQAMTRARSTLAEARKVIDDLRSTSPAGVNLEDFIEEEADHFTALTGLPCEVTLDIKTALPDELALQVEKIVSEGLTNIVRHARAGHSWIHLDTGPQGLSLEVGDDGQGFAGKGYQFENGHYGLVGIRERTRLAGGTLQIESQPGQGTVLKVRIPLSGSKKANS
jgi:NarL family two-component system sensor histidine kinase YdfH